MEAGPDLRSSPNRSLNLSGIGLFRRHYGVATPQEKGFGQSSLLRGPCKAEHRLDLDPFGLGARFDPTIRSPGTDKSNDEKAPGGSQG